jgi:hypothetical protein
MDAIASGSSAYIQAERIIRIETPLGADVLRLCRKFCLRTTRAYENSAAHAARA